MQCTSASAGISATTYFGLAMLSMNIALVFSSMAASYAAGSFSVTHLTPIPNFLNVTTKGIQLPRLEPEGLNRTFELIICLSVTVSVSGWRRRTNDLLLRTRKIYRR